MGLNSSIGYTRWQKLLDIFQISTWSSPIKLELNYGLLPSVSFSLSEFAPISDSDYSYSIFFSQWLNAIDIVCGHHHTAAIKHVSLSQHIMLLLYSALKSFHLNAGGLSMNDFIVAAKLDQIRTSDLAPRKRIWA